MSIETQTNQTNFTTLSSKPRYVTESQLAEMTQRSQKSWQRDRLTGNGPAYIKCGGKILYDMKDVEAWFEGRKFKSTSEYDQ